MRSRFSWKEMSRVFRRIFRCYMCRFTPSLVAFFGFAAAAVAFSVLGPRILGLATTQIFTDVMAMAEGRGDGVDFPYITRIALTLLIIYAGSAFCQYMQGRLMTRITNRSTYFIRQDISKKLNQLPLAYFACHDHAQILSYVTNDADVIGFSLNQVMTQLINTGMTLAGITLIMFTMNWMLALIVLAVLPISLTAAHFIGRSSQHHYDELQTALSGMTAHAADVYLIHDILRSGKGNAAQLAEFDRLNTSLYESAWRSQFVSGTLQPAVSAVSSFAYVGVCVIGSMLAAARQLTIGEIQAFIQYVRSFTQPVTQLASVAASIQHTLAAAKRIFAFLDADEMPLAEETSAVPAVRGNVAFEDVCVRDEHGRLLLDGISFSIPAGALVAVAGAHGAGKSLLLKTLTGLVPPAAGRVVVDGLDPASLGAGMRRRIFGAAFLDPWLETDTISANAAYGQPGASSDEIRDAAQQMHASDFLGRRSRGLDEPVAERHRNLSHGEAELLQLVRILLTGSPITVLDDAVRSVDPLLQQQSLAALRASGSGTFFLATEDPEYLKLADYIILLEEGRVAAWGNQDVVRGSAAFRRFLSGSPE